MCVWTRRPGIGQRVRRNLSEALRLQPQADRPLRLRGLPHEWRHFLWKLSSETQLSLTSDLPSLHTHTHTHPCFSCTQFTHIYSNFKTMPEGNSPCSSRFLFLLINFITSPFISLDKQIGLLPAPSHWPVWGLSRGEVLEAESHRTLPNFSCFPCESHCEKIKGF